MGRSEVRHLLGDPAVWYQKVPGRPSHRQGTTSSYSSTTDAGEYLQQVRLWPVPRLGILASDKPGMPIGIDVD
jgi:hypothetical protein